MHGQLNVKLDIPVRHFSETKQQSNSRNIMQVLQLQITLSSWGNSLYTVH